ncbi:PilW family protein [Caenimonas terrae]|uniref:PilW family protein n=1 Tax=Caenimonas terrae TaxID=696074 RepID=A0ABW0N5H6_9BURK
MQLHPRRARLQRGVSLIETMVGLALGLMITLVVTQVWGAFEGQKQRTISSSSAQVNGLLALTELEQDLRNAGAGLTDSAAFDCTTVYSYYESGGTVVSPIPAYVGGGMSMIPVQIIDGGTGSDQLTVKRSADLLGAIPASITQPMPSSSSELNISATTGFADGDTVLAIDSATGKCTVMLVTQVQGAAMKLQHNPGATVTNNPSTSYQTTNGWPAYSSGAKVMKIGQLISHTYAVNSVSQLTLTDNSTPLASTTSTLAADIVNLQAQYGIANAGSQNVNAWVNATAATGWDTLNSAKVKRIKAVRLVIVARSSKREASDVTLPCKDSTGTVVNANGPCVWSDAEPVLNLSADANWKRYRYRIYKTIIPLRNVIWAGV